VNFMKIMLGLFADFLIMCCCRWRDIN